MGIDVLVCNLTRFGDLLQSQQVMDDLHRGGLKTGLVCLENFEPATRLLKNVDRVWALPGAALMAGVDKSWPQACADILLFADQVRRESGAKNVLNLTPSVPARLLARLLAGSGGRISGFGMDESGFGHNNGVWASFLSVAATGRLNSPFNLSNMMRRMALPLGGNLSGSFRLREPDAEAMARADALLAQWRQKSGVAPAGHVAFQTGASSESRQWPVSHFVELGRRLWRQERICPVLLGSKGEEPLADAFASLADYPFVNAVGRTDLSTLGALLLRAGFLVTNDTGTMHLASGLGVPCLAFFLATAQPWDTGPLLPGCCCLEPAMECHPCAFNTTCEKNFACRSAISPQAAGDLVMAWLKQHDWRQGLSEDVLAQCRVWITGNDGHGMARLERAGAKMDEHGLWLEYLRYFWRHILDDLDRLEGFLPDINSGDSDAVPALPGAGMAARMGDLLEQAAQLLDNIGACGAIAQKSSRGGQLLLRNCERLQAMLDSQPHLVTLGAFWREFRLNEGGDLEKFLPALPVLGRNLRHHAAKLASAANLPDNHTI